jgi:hypothetical protein
MKTILYTKKNTAASTTYTNMDKHDKTWLFNRLQEGYFDLVEKSNYDDSIRAVLYHQDADYCKHFDAHDQRYNCLASVLAGLFRQHMNNPSKDIAQPLLKSITLATRVFNAYDPKFPVVVFEEERAYLERAENKTFNSLFDVD